MACTECHAAKVKCDRELPCSRCVRLSRVCLQHESKQGQGGRDASRRKRRRGISSVDDGLGPSEDAALSTEVASNEMLRSDHYGLQYLIRSWVSLAVRRRSFPLLFRATAKAARCGISMDQIMCELVTQNPSQEQRQYQRGMDFPYSILLTPAAQQQVTGDQLQYTEIPTSLWEAINCPSSVNSGNDTSLNHAVRVGNRWIWIREIKRGISRHFVSSAFQHDVASWSLVQETFAQNEKSVIDLFLSATERPKHTRAFAHQISIHTQPNTQPVSSRLSRIQLQTKDQGLVVEVDQVSCLVLLNLDHAFYCNEYIRRDEASSSNTSSSVKPVDPALTGLDIDLPFLDLNDLDDDSELEFFLDLFKS
jgi:hypothetical protein